MKRIPLAIGGLAALLIAGAALADSVAHRDAAFMKDAAHAGAMEIEGAQLALSKTSSAEVRNFAQHIIEDHTQAAKELSELAASKGVKLPEGPSLAQRAKLKMLGSHDGAKFDQKFAETIGVGAHEDAVKLFSKESGKAKDADVKAFASKTLPTLQHHLEMARALQTTTGKS
ncbi:DUF4142 domain-containing protein [Pelomonas sp. KK5]|uniref:DUF4142 domain-containing protein n=1 Tax=Pelomonas sp. KK5 TaxID=1855730 RepID=UPI00117FE41B|nr:DUF4142 domain-containing protein [Pelomonas sp. KK5]